MVQKLRLRLEISKKSADIESKLKVLYKEKQKLVKNKQTVANDQNDICEF